MAGGSDTTTIGSRLAGMVIQTSLLGQPLAIGWGRGKLSCNLIDYLNWRAIPHTTVTNTGGGKGGGSSTSSTNYTYSADVVLAICDAPTSGIIGINTVWKDASKFTGAGCLSKAGLSAFLGSSSQLPWPYLSSSNPSHALAYRTMAYAYAQAYDLGSNGVVANHSFEVDFALQFNHAGGVYDANPKDIINDFLTNAVYGVTTWPAGLIGDWTQYSNYCVANGLLLSPVLEQTLAANQFIQRLMDETHSDCFYSEGLLKVVPLGDATATGNGVTFTPNLTPIVDLNEDDFLGEVDLEVMDQTDAYNYIQVKFRDRSNEYNDAVAIAYDLDNIVQFGRRQQDPQQFDDICDPQVARTVAQLWLQRQLYIRDQYKFDLPEDTAVYLEPRDLVTLSTLVDGMLLNRQLVSILSIDEDPDGKNVFHIVAEGIPGHTASAALYAAHIATGFAPNVDADPGNVTGVVLINAPPILANRSNQAYAAIAGGPNWGGAVVWISVDNVGYTKIGTISQPGTFGVLSASLASHSDPDTVDTLSVDLTSSAGSLPTVTDAEADAGATLCLVDNELLSYASATLTTANNYNLTYLRRGQRTPIAAHSIGASFLRIDDSIFKFVYPTPNAGSTIYVKFQSFNSYGRALQDISTLSPYTLTLSSTTLAPSGASVAPGYRSNIIRWTNPTSNDFEYVKIYESTTNDPNTATVVGDSVIGDWTHQNLIGGTTYYYWLAAVDFAGNVGPLIAAGSGQALTIALYEGIGADGELTPLEKQEIILEWTRLTNEKSSLDSAASTYAVTTEATAYDNAYSTLSSYLTGLSPAYNDTSQNTAITRTTWNSNWANLYSARQNLLNKLNAVAAASAAAGDSNRVHFTLFERGLTGWAAQDAVGAANPSFTILSLTGGGGILGNYLRGLGAFTANNQEFGAGTDTSGLTNGVNQFTIPVTAGERIFAGAVVWIGSAFPAAGTWTLSLGFLDVTGAETGSRIAIGSGTGPITISTRYGAFGNVPASAVSAFFRFDLFNHSGGAASNVDFYFGFPLVCSAGALQTVWPAFMSGPGSIPTDNATSYSVDLLANYSFPYTYNGTQNYTTSNVVAHLKDQSGTNIASGLTWKYAVISGTVNGNAGDNGVAEYAMTIDSLAPDSPYIPISSLGSNINVIEIRAYEGSIMWPKRTELDKEFAAAPAPSGGGGAGSLSVSSGVSGSIGSSTPVTVATLNGTTPTGVTSVSLSLTADLSDISGSKSGSGTVTAKFQRLIGGTWTDVGASGSGTAKDVVWNPQDGSLNISTSDSGLSASTAYQWRVIAWLSAGADSISMGGNATVTG